MVRTSSALFPLAVNHVLPWIPAALPYLSYFFDVCAYFIPSRLNYSLDVAAILSVHKVRVLFTVRSPLIFNLPFVLSF